MTPKEILKGNKLISNFMGRIKEHEKIEDCEDPIILSIERDGFSGEVVSRKTRPFTHADEKYHSSWGWLMPVVEKIDNLAEYEVILYSTSTHIKRYVGKPDYNNMEVGKRLEATWQAVVEFIKWHNKNK